ncbi:MAG: sugar phosphate isomerase/epimerase [Mobilitalea sp.]
MQIGIRLHDTSLLSLEQRLEVVKQQGFTCAHLALSKVINEFKITPGTLTPGFAMYLKKLFHKYDIDIAVLGCYLNLAEADSLKRQDILNNYQAHIRFASVLGCGVVGTETSGPDFNNHLEMGQDPEKAILAMIENLKRIVAYAEKMGVIVAIEPVRSHLVATPQLARWVLDEINSPNLQIIFDPVNLLGKDNYLQQAVVMEEAIQLLGEDIAVVHLKDFVPQNDKLAAVAAGTGNMNYSPIIRFIKNKKPMIHCTLENTKPENAEAARKHLQKLWEEAWKGAAK